MQAFDFETFPVPHFFCQPFHHRYAPVPAYVTMDQARDATSWWLNPPYFLHPFLKVSQGPVIFIIVRSIGEEAVGKLLLQPGVLVTEFRWRRPMVGQVQIEDDWNAFCIRRSVGPTVGNEVYACVDVGLVASTMRPGVLGERQRLFSHANLEGRMRKVET